MIGSQSQRVVALMGAVLCLPLAACESGDITINGKEGVPLSELAIAGPAPTELVLSSGDTVILSDGDTFSLKVEGTDTDSLRFVRDDKVIGITREKGWRGNSAATIRITMPPPREMVIAGSGTIRAQSLAPTSEISIGGSGEIDFARAAAQKLSINIGGSGEVRGAGTAKELAVAIGGSGDVDLTALKADKAEVSIGGSGDVAFASDGEVTANMAGAGDVKVTGTAKCTVNAMGSGKLTCSPGRSGGAASSPAAPVASPVPSE